MKPHFGCLTLALAMAATPSLHAEDTPDALARKTLEQFLKAYKASDIDGLMAAVDTPWFHDGKELIKDREELKRQFHKELGRDKERSTLKHKVSDVVTYKTVREKLREEERKFADEVLHGEDRILLVRMGQDVSGEQGDKVAFMVRIREGKAKVVGLKD